MSWYTRHTRKKEIMQATLVSANNIYIYIFSKQATFIFSTSNRGLLDNCGGISVFASFAYRQTEQTPQEPLCTSNNIYSDIMYVCVNKHIL